MSEADGSMLLVALVVVPAALYIIGLDGLLLGLKWVLRNWLKLAIVALLLVAAIRTGWLERAPDIISLIDLAFAGAAAILELVRSWRKKAYGEDNDRTT